VKISDLLEAKEVTLIGKTIEPSWITFTAEMSGKPWNGNFHYTSTDLTTLKGGPSLVSGSFACYNNKLTSLEGAPSFVNGKIDVANNKLTSLHDVHKIIKKMNGIFWARGNPITSCVLGVLLIDNCTGLVINNNSVQKIINKYLPNDRGFSAVIECQSELLDAGFDEFAKL